MITGENQRPDLIVISNNKSYLLEQIAGYETNIYLNSKRKEESYRALMDSLAYLYNSGKFIKLSMGSLGIYGETSTSLVRFLSDLGMNKKESSLCAKYVVFVFDAHTTYFAAGIKNRAILSFSISKWRLWCIVVLHGQYGYSANYYEL